MTLSRREPSTLLSINNYYYRRGGAEVVFLEQNRLFEEAGWRVVPFAMRHANNVPSAWQEYFVEEIEFGERYSLWQKARRAAKITYSFEARRRIAQLIDQVRPDVAHAHNVYHHISPAIFGTLKGRGVPVVLTLHDLKIACPAYKMLTHDGVCERCKGGRIWNVVAHRCIKDSLTLSTTIFIESGVHRLLGCYSRNVDRFVTPSRFYIDKFVEWGWARERFVHIPNFTDLDVHQPNRDVGQAFLYFGRLGHEKGLATFIRAAAIAGAPAWIVGTGPEENSLRQLASDLRANVEFRGHCTGPALHEVIRRSRAVVLPSEWYENAPLTLLEAYALGRPVIGANIGGIPELIRDGETGAMFPSGNAEALASTLGRFSELPDSVVAEMGYAGRDWVERDFTAASYRERLLDLYRAVIGAC